MRPLSCRQEYTSKDTCVSVVNKVYKKYPFKSHSLILDYGGGKYDKNAEYMLKKNASKVYVYDKYNRSQDHNDAVLDYMGMNKPDYVVCSNVLNVIKEDSVIDEILRFISTEYREAVVLIVIYERNKTGIPEVTSRGYQRNERKEKYYPLIKKYFTVLNTKDDIIECRSK